MNQDDLVLYLSLYYLDDISLVRACQVNTKFYRKVCNQIWFDRLEQKYSDVINTFPDTIKVRSYREQYLLLQDLNRLKAMYKRLESLSLLDIYQLRRLDLSDLGLKFLPREIGQLNNLRLLNVYKNQLKFLPREIGRLTNLLELNVRNNQLTELPREIKFLNNLDTVNVSDNQLTFLPQEIKFLNKLESLSVHSNQLKFLPQEIKYLNNLQRLYLSGNQLTELPLEIKYLNNLKYLYVYNNQLKFLPRELGQLNLHELYVDKFTELPQEIRNIPSIRYK